MKFEDEAKLILEAVAKTATSERTRDLARHAGRKVATRVKSLGFRVFSEVMDRMGDEQPQEDSPIKPYISKPVSAQQAAARFAQEKRAQVPEESPAEKPPGSAPTVVTEKPSTGPQKTQDPKRYGINRVVLLIRRADRAFAYWEIDEQRIPEGAQGRLELIDADTEELVQSVDADLEQGKQYFDIPPTKQRYVVDLIAAVEGQEQLLLSRSHPAQFDPDNPTGSQPPTKNPRI